METETLLVGAVLYLTLLLSVLFLFYCVQRLEIRGAKSLTVMFSGLILWILADVIQYHTPGDPLPAVGLPIRLLGPDLLVIGVLLFALEYTGRSRYLDRRVLALLGLKPLVSQVTLVSPLRTDFIQRGGTEVIVGYDIAMTPLFTVYTGYNWILALGGIALLGQMMLRSRYAHEKQLSVILLSILIPFAFNIVARTGLFVQDLTSVSFGVTAALFMYATFRLRLMDTLPIARQQVLAEMDDMVLVLDESGDIIEINDATREAFSQNVDILGKPVSTVFETYQFDAAPNDEPVEVTVTLDGERRYLDVSKSTLTDNRENVIAEVLVCRDVTEKHERERELKEREEDLKLLKDLQSRFFRHNLRNELNVIRAHAQMTLDDSDPEEKAFNDLIHEKTDRMLDWSTKARAIERLIDSEATVDRDIDREIVRLVERLAGRYEHVQFETDLTGDARIEAVPQVERALENLLDNAARYNTASAPVVRIQTNRVDGAVAVTIEDNGPGIETVEIDTIREREEEPLKHSSGFGLWLAYWVVEKSDGDIEFETDDNGTTVTLTFESTEAES